MVIYLTISHADQRSPQGYIYLIFLLYQGHIIIMPSTPGHHTDVRSPYNIKALLKALFIIKDGNFDNEIYLITAIE